MYFGKQNHMKPKTESAQNPKQNQHKNPKQNRKIQSRISKLKTELQNPKTESQTSTKKKEIKDRPARAPNVVFVVASRYQMSSTYIFALTSMSFRDLPLL